MIPVDARQVFWSGLGPSLEEATDVVSLCYHDVYEHSLDDVPAGVDERHYAISLDTLRTHVVLAKNRRAAPLPNRGDGASPPAILFTFDDGWASSAELVAPALEAMGCRGVFFVTSGMIGCKGFIRREQVRNLHAAGHMIASHSHTHPDGLDRSSAETIRREWGTSIAILSELTGSAVTWASVPGGAYSRRVATAAQECGIQRLFTSIPAVVPQTVAGLRTYGRFSVTALTESSDILSWLDIAPLDLFKLRLAWTLRRAASRIGGSAWTYVRKLALRTRQR